MQLKRNLAAIFLTLAVILGMLGWFEFLYQADNKYTSGPPYGSDGVFSFSDADLYRNKPLFLIDGWELYPDKIYTPDDLTQNAVTPDRYTFIGQYSHYGFFNAARSPFGAATYRIILQNTGEPRVLSLEIPEIFSQYTVWVNGEPLAQAAGENLISFQASTRTELVISAENHSHYYSGLYYPPALGLPSTVQRMFFLRILFYAVLSISSLTLCLFSLVLWFERKNDPLFFHFGLLCLFFGLHCLYPFFHQLGLSGPFWYMVEDVSLLAMLASAIAICSIQAGFSQLRWYRLGIRPICIAFCLLCAIFVLLIVPSYGVGINFYGLLLDIYRVLCWAYLTLCAFRCLRFRQTGSWLILAGGGVLGASLLVNLMDNNRFEPVYTGWQTEYAGFILVLIFSGLMVLRNRELLHKNRMLSDHLEQLVQERTAELHAVLDERKNFFSDMAHNLKAPIATVHSFINLIREENLYVDNELRTYLDQIESENIEMQRRVQALNTLNAFDRIDTAREPIDVGLLLSRIYEDNAPEAFAAGIHFSIEPPKEPVRILGQEEKLLVLFENLIFNAISFTPANGSISIRTQLDGKYIVISVADTGSGILPDHLPHIFKRFYSVRDKKDKGSGLGLYIAKITVEELGGTISVSSEPGAGSVFTVRIPYI